MLKFCYVPATSAGLPRFLFAAAINSTNYANKAIKQSILLICLWFVGQIEFTTDTQSSYRHRWINSAIFLRRTKLRIGSSSSKSWACKNLRCIIREGKERYRREIRKRSRERGTKNRRRKKFRDRQEEIETEKWYISMETDTQKKKR